MLLFSQVSPFATPAHESHTDYISFTRSQTVYFTEVIAEARDPRFKLCCRVGGKLPVRCGATISASPYSLSLIFLKTCPRTPPPPPPADSPHQRQTVVTFASQLLVSRTSFDFNEPHCDFLLKRYCQSRNDNALYTPGSLAITALVLLQREISCWEQSRSVLRFLT